jgi:hypothetical protein
MDPLHRIYARSDVFVANITWCNHLEGFGEWRPGEIEKLVTIGGSFVLVTENHQGDFNPGMPGGLPGIEVGFPGLAGCRSARSDGMDDPDDPVQFGSRRPSDGGRLHGVVGGRVDRAASDGLAA